MQWQRVLVLRGMPGDQQRAIDVHNQKYQNKVEPKYNEKIIVEKML